MMSLRGVFFGVGILTLWLVFFPQPILAAPSITNVQSNSNSIPRYEKFELTFQLSTLATNLFYPFDASPPAGIPASQGISVDATFTAPDGRTYLQPAFIYQYFDDRSVGNNEWFYPKNQFDWKVRFSPNLIGNWSVYLTAKDSTGTTTTLNNPINFTVTNSTNHGFIKVSPDPRYFEYTDGTYFPALGYNLNGGNLDNANPTLGNTDEFSKMGPNGIQMSRMWISQFSIYGESWGGWSSNNIEHNTQEQRYGIVHPLNWQIASYPTLVAPTPPPGSEYYMWLDYDDEPFIDDRGTPDPADDRTTYPMLTPCRFIENVAVKSNSTYRIAIKYQTRGVEGPKIAGQPYGFAIKTTNEYWGNPDPSICNNFDKGTLVSNVVGSTDTTGWSTLTGTINIAANDFAPDIYLSFHNVADKTGDNVAGHVFIDEVSMQQDLGNNQFGPNIFTKPDMDMHQYINQRQAYSFDKLLDLAKQHGVYIKAVMNEKNDRIFQSIAPDGSFSVNPSGVNFYGSGSTNTKVRWLQKAWWRYMQGRWGFSPNIQSWELLNEGDFSQNHNDLADEFSKFMHCRVFGVEPTTFTVSGQNFGLKCQNNHPNSHLTSTSTFGPSYAFNLFNNGGNGAAYQKYRDIDSADQHIYANYNDTGQFASFYDSAMFTYKLSTAANYTTNSTAKGTTVKPFIRGEAGWSFPSPTFPEDYFRNNREKGIWLHDYIWGGINYGGILEQYFAGGFFTEHIYKAGSHDHRPMFKHYYDFIKDVPLNNQLYRDVQAATTSATIRAWGQKDTSNNRAHLWISNIRHTWCTYIGTVPGCPLPAWSTLTATQKRLLGTVTIGGFTPNTSLPIEWWYFDEMANLIEVPFSATSSNASGVVTLDLDLLPANVVDAGVKIGNYSATPATRRELLQNWLTPTTDQNDDGKVNSMDFVAVP
jgi:hypothetical protein